MKIKNILFLGLFCLTTVVTTFADGGTPITNLDGGTPITNIIQVIVNFVTGG